MMKKMSKKNLGIVIAIALIIIVGAIIIMTKGLNFDLKFQETKRVELYIGKQFEISDIKQITNEVMPNQKVIIQTVEVYKDSVSIIAKEITEEQKNNLINKINEKYELQLTAEGTEITVIPHTRGRDLLKPYILPFSIATVIILVYMAVRYRKLGIVKVVLKTVGIAVLAQVILLSIIALVRIPVGRLTMPMVIAVYMLTLIALTTKFDKECRVGDVS